MTRSRYRLQREAQVEAAKQVEIAGKIWRFVDTAGLRRKVGQASGHEFYASVRTHSAIDAAEVCVVLIDGSQPITEQDQRVRELTQAVAALGASVEQNAAAAVQEADAAQHLEARTETLRVLALDLRALLDGQPPSASAPN